MLQIQIAYLTTPPGTALDWCTSSRAETQIAPLLGEGLGELDGDELGLWLWVGLGLDERVDVCDGLGLFVGLWLWVGLGLFVGLWLCVGLGLFVGLELDDWLALLVGLCDGLELASACRWRCCVMITLVSLMARTLAAAAPHGVRGDPALAAMTGPNAALATMKEPTATRAVSRAVCAMLSGTRITAVLAWPERVPRP